MTDVILINSPIILNRKSDQYLYSEGDEKSNYPMGLLYIAGYLEQKGVSVKVLDVAAAHLMLEDILQTVAEAHPILVGISAMTPGIRSAVTIAREIRIRLGRNVSIALGGSHVNSDETFIQRYPVFDFCVIGEGEKTTYDAFVKLKEGRDVHGLLQGESIDDLDALPFPARHLIDIHRYFRDEERRQGQRPAATMLGSRGCPYHCSFCSIPVIRHKVRYRSAGNIVDEMEAIYESCGGRYSFVDDVLTLSKKRTIELCDEIIRRRLKVKWCGMTRANTLTEKMVRHLSAAGCNDLFIGVESGNQRIRNEVIGKEITDDQIREAVKLCRKHDIHTNLFLMIGFPTESLHEVEDTIRIGQRVHADLIGIRITVPFPGTKIFEYAEQEGMIPPDLVDRYIQGKLGGKNESFYRIWPLFIPRALNLQTVVRAKKRAYRQFYLNPAWIFRRILYWIRHPDRFTEDLKLFRIAPYALARGKTPGSMS